MRKHAAMVERSTGAGRCWYTSASGGPPTPVDVSVTPVTKPAVRKAPLPGSNEGANSVIRTARTVEIPMSRPSWRSLTRNNTHRPPKVPTNRPRLIQVVPATSSA